MEHFFSTKYADRGELFEGLSIWEDEEFRKLQGIYPVISLSFANVKEPDYETTRRKICQLLVNLYVQNSFLLDSDILTEKDRAFFRRVSVDMGDVEASMALCQLSDYLTRYYGKKVIILLDEYDTPMQGAGRDIKKDFDILISGAALKTRIDEQIVYNQLNQDESAIWSLLLASGYLKVETYEAIESDYDDRQSYELVLTNHEVILMFRTMIRGWFQASVSDYNDFIKSLLIGDIEAMNLYMNKVTLATFCCFDMGKQQKASPNQNVSIMDLGDMILCWNQRKIVWMQSS